jgi:hypothetical protein
MSGRSAGSGPRRVEPLPIERKTVDGKQVGDAVRARLDVPKGFYEDRGSRLP